MKRIISLLSALIVVLSIFTMCIVPSNAAGDSLATATPIEIGTSYSGTITETNNIDFYKINLSTSGRLNIKLTAYIYKTHYYIYNVNGDCIWSWRNQYWNNVSEQYDMDTFVDLTSGTYYFCIERSDGTGNFNFKFSFTSSNESFKETTQGINNTMAKASAISTGQSYNGQLALNDDKDFYKFNLSTSGAVTIKLRAYIYKTNYYIYDVNGDCVWSWRYQYWNGVSEQYDMNTVVHLTSGNYYFCVERCDGTGNYNFRLGFTNANESFKETTGGINNTLATASKISLNTKYNGQIADNDNKDFYMFTMPNSGNIKLSIDANIYKTHYYIYDSKGNVVWELRYQYWNDTSKKYTNTQIITLSKGTYYFCIEKAEGGGNYNFTISLNITVGKVSSLKASQSTSTVSLSWGKVSGATGYQVYKYDSAKKKYVYTATVSSNTYKASKLKSGTTYKYAVRAYKKVGSTNYYGSFSYITTATKPGTPTLVAKAGTKKVSLSWNKQTGATGYVVYMATSKNGTYKKIATVKGSTNVSYIRTGLTKGNTYYFKVRAYKIVDGKNIYGSYSAIKSAKVK